MTDLFGDWVTDEMIDRVFAVMALSPQHTFQVLTKRADRMRNYLSLSAGSYGSMRLMMIAKTSGDEAIKLRLWPLPNVWLGVSVEDQRRADERIPVLLETPAAVRWLSVEPQLEHIDLRLMDDYISDPGVAIQSCHSGRISWAVCGGESGAGSRPFDIRWARSIIAQCAAAGVACFVKQLGSNPRLETCVDTSYFKRDDYRPRDRKGGDISEFPPDLRVREYPKQA
jgi:protein gp37